MAHPDEHLIPLIQLSRHKCSLWALLTEAGFQGLRLELVSSASQTCKPPLRPVYTMLPQLQICFIFQACFHLLSVSPGRLGISEIYLAISEMFLDISERYVEILRGGAGRGGEPLVLRSQ